MARSRFNRGVFLLEALNSLGTTLFFNYLFFFFKAEYGFSNKENLLVGALNGFIYVPCALYGGKLGQKHGYLFALKVGLVTMCAGLLLGSTTSSITGILIAMCIWTVGMCFTWPNLEALACDRQPADKLPATIGIYNVVWSGASAIAYFGGGAVAQTFGWRSIFLVPVLIHLVQIGVALSMRSNWRTILETPLARNPELERPHRDGALFLKLAWLANPFAYIAINAAIPLIPDVASRFQLSPAFAGFFCSIWFFARTATFVALALWQGWHYQFKYLAAAFVGMLFSFFAMLSLNSLPLVIAVQIFFGWCIGLIYYSSLYYSMHVGETKGEHGGMHEAAIGVGIFGGPAIGAASIFLAPGQPQASAFGVALAIIGGFAALLRLQRRGRIAASQPAPVTAPAGASGKI
jgi:predicted MFS family arabinose efflux permease